MANLPHRQIARPSKFSELQSIETIDLVGPSAANRQPNTLRDQTGELRSIVDKLVEDMNALTGKDEGGNNVTADGNPQYMERDGSHPALGNWDMGSNRVTNAADAQDPQDLVTLSQLSSESTTLQAQHDDLLPRDGSRPMLANLPFGDNRGTGVNNPVNPKDAANKRYVDQQLSVVTGGADAADFDSDFFLYPARQGADIVHGLSNPDFAFMMIQPSVTDVGTVTMPTMQVTDRKFQHGYVFFDGTVVHVRNRGDQGAQLLDAGNGGANFTRQAIVNDDALEFFGGEESSQTIVRVFEKRTSGVSRYDSGWFSVIDAATYTKVHNLGQFPDVTIVEFADDPDPANQTFRVPCMGSNPEDQEPSNRHQCNVVKMDDTHVTLRTDGGSQAFFDAKRGDFDVGHAYKPSGGFARILMYDWTPDYDTGWLRGRVYRQAEKSAFWIQHNRNKLPSLVMSYLRVKRDEPATVTFTDSNQPADGDTISIADDDGNQETFEFDNDNSVSSGNIAVTIGVSVENTRDNLTSAINNSSLNVSTSNGSNSPPVTEMSGRVVKVRPNTSVKIEGFANVLTSPILGNKIVGLDGMITLDVASKFITLMSGKRAPLDLRDEDGLQVDENSSSRVERLNDSTNNQTYVPIQYRVKVWD